MICIWRGSPATARTTQSRHPPRYAQRSDQSRHHASVLRGCRGVHAVRHLFAAYHLGRDTLYAHIKKRKSRTQFIAFCRYLRTLYPPEVRIAIVADNFSPHLSTKTDTQVGDWAAGNNVELACTPFYASWLNRIEAQFTALRCFTLDGTDHEPHEVQGRMIRRYIAWRNRNANAHDRALREIVKRANIA